ncbi:mechanosensitive ion channel family protein [Burkholderia sp. Bp8963]|uniref:mechanosensitive ion channel family protein n=1 Tax=Burkholderia sp. Bp8963 TaxID=2184547 RepID=UPI0021AB7DDD|nr:mechanosensitive ion channel domain-containing protein [Burkholderia sp. Bp8963]
MLLALLAVARGWVRPRIVLCAAALGLAFAQPAGAAVTPPGLAAFQKLIAPAAADAPASASGASGAPSSASAASGVAASGTAAASAPSPASAAEIARSFNAVIRMLDNDRQRTALVSQLKALRDVAQTAQAASAASAASDANAGLWGAIASGMASVEANMKHGDSPARYWAGRFNAAGNELYTIVSGQGPESFGVVVLDFVLLLLGWGACAIALIWLQQRLAARAGVVIKLNPNPSAGEMLRFALRRVGPWIIAFAVVFAMSRNLPESLGRIVALVVAYVIVAGSVFAALCLIMFALFSAGHRRAAGHVLIERSWRLLRVIGAFGALGDAALNYDIAHQLGTNLAGLIATVANMAAATLCAYFALAYRRPVAHLIRNRSHMQRTQHRATTEMAEFAAWVWPVPVLLLAFAAVLGTLAGSSTSSNLLQTSVVTALLLVLAFFLSAVVLRITRPNPTHRRVRRNQSAYIARLVRFAGSLVTLLIWLGYVELTSRLWGISIARIVEHSVAARGIAQAVTAIVVTWFVSWLTWIIVDTAILEALNAAAARRGRNPSVRARTMLPLVRNVVFMTILTIAAVVTAANLGINVTPLLAGAGVIGLAVGFGAQSLVSDLITGLFIIVEDTISVGDWIDVDGGHAGTVEHLSIRTVRLRDGQGALHAIPFSQIKIVKNLSRDFGCAVFEVRAPLSADVDALTHLIRDAGADLWSDFTVRRLMLGGVEVWGLDRFEPNWLIVKGQIRTQPQQQAAVMRAFNARVKARMEAAGIEIPVPQMQVVGAPWAMHGEPVADVSETPVASEAAPLVPVAAAVSASARSADHAGPVSVSSPRDGSSA